MGRVKFRRLTAEMDRDLHQLVYRREIVRPPNVIYVLKLVLNTLETILKKPLRFIMKRKKTR